MKSLFQNKAYKEKFIKVTCIIVFSVLCAFACMHFASYILILKAAITTQNNDQCTNNRNYSSTDSRNGKIYYMAA